MHICIYSFPLRPSRPSHFEGPTLAKRRAASRKPQTPLSYAVVTTTVKLKEISLHLKDI